MDYEARVRWMFDRYGPVVRQIHERFEGPGGRVGHIFANSQLAEIDMLQPGVRDALLAKAKQGAKAARGQALAVPLGLDVRDPAAVRLEEAVRRRLDLGLVVSDSLLQALFAAPPQRFLTEADAIDMVEGRTPPTEPEGALPTTLPLSTLLIGLQAIAPGPGERAVDLGARTGHVAALLAELVGPRGEVLAVAETETDADRLRIELADWPTVEVVVRGPGGRFDVPGGFDVVWMGAALPRVPKQLLGLLRDGGRLLTAVGPRYRDQDLVWVGSDGAERILGRVRLPVLGGRHGWVPAPPRPRGKGLQVGRWPAPALLFEVLAAVDVGPDVAAVGPGGSEAPWARRIAAAWHDGDRLGLQALGLVHERVDDLLAGLRRGDALAQAVADGVEALRDGFDPAFAEAAPWRDELDRLREALYAPQGRPAPPLMVLDVPALGRRARGTMHRGGRRVATSLAEPPEHVLMQLFHEEVHPVTDPLVLAELGDALPRDTRPGRPGFAVHERLEATVVAATEAFLGARAPEHLPAFEAWRRRLGRGG
jgi:protein-L-isoaspartate O-methyltransferase